MSKATTKRLLIVFFVLETLCATEALVFEPLIPLASIIYPLGGLAIAVLVLFLPKARQSFSIQENIHHLPSLSFRIMAVNIMCIELFHFSNTWISDAPLDYHDADMLPIMKIMCERFLSGHWSQVYSPIPEIWQGVQPVYLPAMWMPFCAGVVANMDIRWVTAICLAFVFVIFIFVFHPSHQKKNSPYIIAMAFVLFWWLSVQQEYGLIPYTEEGVVIFYYVILTLALLNGNIWFIGIAISLCVLSRYSLIGWLLPFLLLLLYEKKYRSFFKLMLTGAVALLLFMVIPFGWGPFQKLLALPNEYIDFGLRVWKDAPIVFSSGLGLAKFFGPQHILLQHRLLIILTFTIPLLFVLIAIWLKEKRSYPIHNIGLASFKLSLVVFYNLIDVPYNYLFYTSSFVSLIMVSYFVSLQEDVK